MAVISPADHLQTETALRATWDAPGAIYYRLGKDDRTQIPGLDGRFRLGRVECVRDGSDLLIVTMGSVTTEAAAAAELLADQGVACTLAVVSSINPAPEDDLAELLRRFPVAMTVEAHYINGGLGSVVLEVVAEQGLHCQVVRCGIRRLRPGESGSQDYLYRVHGLGRDALVGSALRAISQAKTYV
jgi:transketolase